MNNRQLAQDARNTIPILGSNAPVLVVLPDGTEVHVLGIKVRGGNNGAVLLTTREGQ